MLVIGTFPKVSFIGLQVREPLPGHLFVPKLQLLLSGTLDFTYAQLKKTPS